MEQRKKHIMMKQLFLKSTKIVISDEDELDIKIDNKEEITAFIEGLDTDSWSSIDDIPNDAILRRNISAYSFRRRTKEKVLTNNVYDYVI